MEEQPVALATIMRSPNSWVTSLTYGVSPQPAHAPENSNSGLLELAVLHGLLVNLALEAQAARSAYSQSFSSADWLASGLHLQRLGPWPGRLWRSCRSRCNPAGKPASDTAMPANSLPMAAHGLKARARRQPAPRSAGRDGCRRAGRRSSSCRTVCSFRGSTWEP